MERRDFLKLLGLGAAGVAVAASDLLPAAKVATAPKVMKAGTTLMISQELVADAPILADEIARKLIDGMHDDLTRALSSSSR